MANESLPQRPTSNQNENTFAERAKRRYLRTSAENGAAASPDVGTPDLGHLPGLALFATALLALELANAATTFRALDNLMGAAGVLGASFAVVLTVGLAAMDTGGIVNLFGPRAERLNGAGLLFTAAAWLLCATTNAILTWWAVSAAMSGHASGNVVLTQAQLLDVAPPFLALGLWLMRLLLVAGMAQGESR